MDVSRTPRPCRRPRPRLLAPPLSRASAAGHSVLEGMRFRLRLVRPSTAPSARLGRVRPFFPLPLPPLSASSGLQAGYLEGYRRVCSALDRDVRGTPRSLRSAPPGTPRRQSLGHSTRPARVSAVFRNPGKIRLVPGCVRVPAGAARAGALEDVSARVDGEVFFAGIVGGHTPIHNGGFRGIVELQAVNVLHTPLVHPASPKFQEKDGRTK